MIEDADVVSRLLGAATTIESSWAEYRAAWGDEPSGFYIDVGVVARHVIAALARGATDEVSSIFNAVEDMLQQELSSSARELLVVGFIEDVQNITNHANSPVGSSAFLPYLGPTTVLSWVEMHGYWGSRDT